MNKVVYTVQELYHISAYPSSTLIGGFIKIDDLEVGCISTLIGGFIKMDYLEVGCMATQLSKSFLVAPIFTATPKPW